MNKLYELIDLTKNEGENGSLTMLQDGEAVPFPIKKVLVVQGMKPEDIRGKHAHHKTQDYVVALRGGCTFELDNGGEKETVELRDHNKAILIPPKVWRILKDFEEDTTLLIIADQKYTEDDYIRNYEEFLEITK